METTSKKKVITVSTTVIAPMNKVWDMFNKPEHITKWYFASDDWHAPSAEVDFKAGGIISIRMEAKDGSMGFDFGSTYDRIKDHELIDYTIGDGRKLNVRFESSGNVVKVTESFEAEDMNSHELQRNGWQAILDNFKKYVENN
jgi:uncharacterized protein YndB with AHSA1/START domain